MFHVCAGLILRANVAKSVVSQLCTFRHTYIGLFALRRDADARRLNPPLSLLKRSQCILACFTCLFALLKGLNMRSGIFINIRDRNRQSISLNFKEVIHIVRNYWFECFIIFYV